MTQHDGFTVERRETVATVTLDVPGKLNRVSMAARDQLSAVFAELDADEAVRCIVLTGAGGAFTAGGDIAGFLERSPWAVSQLARNVAAPERCSKPVVARLEGYVLGVGLELALACDFRVAAPSAVFGLPEVGLGIVPSSGGLYRVVRALGPLAARELVLLGRRLDATEALAHGLVTEVVDDPDPLPRALTLATELAALPPLAVAVACQAIDRIAESSREASLLIERLAYAALNQTPEARDAPRP